MIGRLEDHRRSVWGSRRLRNYSTTVLLAHLLLTTTFLEMVLVVKAEFDNKTPEMTSSQNFHRPSNNNNRGEGYRNGGYPLVGAAIGGGLGAAFGALEGPMRAAVLGSAGGTLGALAGSFLEKDRTYYTLGGAAFGGYIGGLCGGFAGGATGQVAETLAVVAAALAVGVAGAMYGGRYIGPLGIFLGALGGVAFGGAIGRNVVGPTATVLVSGIVGGFTSAMGGYLGSTDLVGRRRGPGSGA